MSEEKKKTIDSTEIVKSLWAKRKTFLKVWIVTFILSCLWIFPQPRYYECEVSIAPESSDGGSKAGFSSLASSFGINIGNMVSSSDAIYPQLYPDLLESTDFMVGLFDVKIKTSDGKISTDYFTYMKDYQKPNYLMVPFIVCREEIASLFRDEEPSVPGKEGKRFDPFRLNYCVSEILEGVKGNIECVYSKTTEVVTIKVKDQDPLVCALMADSVKTRLQTFITDYRTKKARIDYNHYKQLAQEARASYDRARQKYGNFGDANQEITLASYKALEEDLENEMQLKYNLYTAMNARLETALARVQERTPAFTTLKNATVPVKPAGPKRVLFVLAMLIVSTFGATGWIFRKQLIEWF